jgi:hypothetical protein
MPEDSERVEELESKVAELEATVRGLTEELVDATERIRNLEDSTGVDPAGGHGRDESATGGVSDPTEAGPEPMVDGADAEPAADPEPEAGDSGADTTKPPADEGSTDTGDSEVVEDDDIIVA